MLVATARTVTDLNGTQANTAALFYRKIRKIIAIQPEAEAVPFAGEVKVDESYFGGRRKEKPGRGWVGKVPVFGLLKRDGKVYPIIELLFKDAGSGTILYQQISEKYDLPIDGVYCIKPEGNKATRAAAITNLIEEGRVFLPRQTQWLEPFRNELLQFPHGRHDDQVDSMVNFLRW